MGYVTDSSAWGRLGEMHGAQDAAYRRGTIKVEPKIRCGGCGRPCTKGRGLHVTRSAVVCTRCLDGGRFGPSTTVTHIVDAREFRVGETVTWESADGYRPREITGVVAKKLRGNRYEVRVGWGRTTVVLGASRLTSKHGE